MTKRRSPPPASSDNHFLKITDRFQKITDLFSDLFTPD